MSATLRIPTADDGMAVAALVEATGVLDVNSVYAYVALLAYFSQTSIVAEDEEGRVVGFVTGFRVPDAPDTLFIWQVGVSEAARGQGLAKRMLLGILGRPQVPVFRHLNTTVSPDNAPSRRLFESVARTLGAELVVDRGFTSEQLGGDHPDEPLLRIGPFTRSPS